MVTTLTIPEKVPSNNGSNGLLRMHWTKKRNLMRTWVWLFKAQTTNRHSKGVSIHLSHYHRGREIADYDNLVSTCKLIFDALTKAGIIVDDNRLITGIPTFDQIRVKDKKDVKTIITITDLNREL
jgi:Holliday junction resolvase RusA-like endonuclease